MSQDVLLHVTHQVAVVTINREESMNTFSPGVIEGIGEAYRRIDEDDDIRVGVITGAGKVFSAGADMSGGGDTFNRDAQRVAIDSCPLNMQAWDVRKPIIAACNGHAVGAGLGLAMQADMRVFADEGKYGFLQSRRGVITDFAMEYVLPRLLGFERAFELLVRAPRLSGQESVAWGLASRSVPGDQVLECAMEIAQDIAVNSAPLAVGLHKRLLWRGLDLSRGELADVESRMLNYVMTKPDAVEGGMAYAERRKPRWTGSIAGEWPEDIGGD